MILIDDLITDSIFYCACVIVRISDDFSDDRHESRLAEIRLKKRMCRRKVLRRSSQKSSSGHPPLGRKVNQIQKKLKAMLAATN